MLTTNEFDALNRVTSIPNTIGTTVLYSATHAYDLVGNRRTIDEYNAHFGPRPQVYLLRKSGETAAGEKACYFARRCPS